MHKSQLVSTFQQWCNSHRGTYSTHTSHSLWKSHQTSLFLTKEGGSGEGREPRIECWEKQVWLCPTGDIIGLECSGTSKGPNVKKETSRQATDKARRQITVWTKKTKGIGNHSFLLPIVNELSSIFPLSESKLTEIFQMQVINKFFSNCFPHSRPEWKLVSQSSELVFIHSFKNTAHNFLHLDLISHTEISTNNNKKNWVCSMFEC